MFGTARPIVAAVVVAMALGAIPMATFAAVNNDRENAIVITDPLPFVDERDTSQATSDPGDPQPSCVPTSATVWYRYTATDYGDLQAHTKGSDYDTTLAVYVVGSEESLTEIACNDDFYTLQSFVTFGVEPDMELLIMVGAYGEEGSGGSLVFTLAEGTEPPFEIPVYEPIDVQLVLTGATVSRSTGHVTVVGTLSCSTEAFAGAWGDVRQRLGRSYITGDLSGFETCGPEPTPFAATTYSESGVFVGGSVQVRLYVDAWDESNYGFLFVEETLRIRTAP